MVNRLSTKELIDFVNNHMSARMFLVGTTITVADIVVFAHLAEHFAGLKDFEKLQLPHAFRWIDHIQHLPGMLD